MRTAEFLRAVSEALGRPSKPMRLEDTPATVKEWDSVGHFSIISAVDALLGVSMTDEEIQGFTSMGQLVSLLKTRKVLED